MRVLIFLCMNNVQEAAETLVQLFEDERIHGKHRCADGESRFTSMIASIR